VVSAEVTTTPARKGPDLRKPSQLLRRLGGPNSMTEEASMAETTASTSSQTNNINSDINTTQPTYTYKVNDYEIAIIGAGGIGSHLVSALVPALHRGEILESTEQITIRMYDSDEVSEGNLAHQR